MKPVTRNQPMLEQPFVLSANQISKKFGKSGKNKDHFWALKNISFELRPGEVLGIIGKNGAGKSTILKIISDIIPPTSGEVIYRGKVVSILDFGTGFHPDLSGYDNILLNASLFGMSKKEIREKIKTVIDFSGIEPFIHQPVKTYSSGMYLRLAFSIAVHINAQIMLLDEVIAVGDRDFRNKCNLKMRELVANGMTIVLVSHNISQILEFCTRCIWIDQGEVKYDGLPIEVAEQYLGGPTIDADEKSDQPKMPITMPFEYEIENFVHLKSISVCSNKNEILVDAPFNIEVECEKIDEESSLEVVISIINMDGIRVFTDSHGLREDYPEHPVKNKGRYKFTCTIPANLFTRGFYTVSLSICKSLIIQCELENIISFKIKEKPLGNNPAANFSKMNTIVRPHLDWKIEMK